MNNNSPIIPTNASQTTTPPQKTNPLSLVLVAFVMFTLGGILGYYFGANKSSLSPASPGQTACTLDAKVCPDGTSVGRVGPDCEFTPCPREQTTIDPIENWKTYSNSEIFLELKYPQNWKITIFANNPKMILVGEDGAITDDKSPGYIRISYLECEELATKEKIPCDSYPQLISNIKYDLSPEATETQVLIAGKSGTQIVGSVKESLTNIAGAYRKITVFPLGNFQLKAEAYHKETEQVYDYILSTFKFTN